MKYFFILGKNPTLSIAEISAVFADARNGEIADKKVFIFETKKKIDAGRIIKKMGGIIKIGLVESEVEENSGALLKIMQEITRPSEKGKFNFGISDYSGRKINLKILGMKIKKYLRQQGVSCRWVTSREPTLSSVVVEQNGLTKEGVEFVLIKSPQMGGKTPPPHISLNKSLPALHAQSWQAGGAEGILVGRTMAVQPFKELSRRDYGRPARDEYSGMLPPKLAQIMINMAITTSPRQFDGQVWQERDRDKIIILDPFCGSGTILTEAMLMGYKNLIGSDVSKKAIEDTKKNIEWTAKNFPASPADGQLSIPDFQLFNIRADQISKSIKPNSVDAIVTEPYLGPQRGKMDIAKIKKELEALYSKSLSEFKKILKPGGRIVMVWPAFVLPFVGASADAKALVDKSAGEKISAGEPIFKKNRFDLQRLSPNLNGLKIINPIPENLRKNDIIKLTEKNTIIYGREGQKVWREIVILKK